MGAPTSEALTWSVRSVLNSVYSCSIVVRVQMLSELEEILDYKSYQDNGQNDKMDTMKKTWMKRHVPAPSVIHTTQTNCFAGYKAVNQTLKCGNGSYKSGLLFSHPKTTIPCGSNSPTYAGKTTG